MKRMRSKNFKAKFSERLVLARTMAGYQTQEAFAIALDVGATRYGHYERGRSAPSMELLATIAKLTECSIDWLVAGYGPPRRKPTALQSSE